MRHNEPDRAIWATWYDIAADRREEYLAWLHGEYLPALKARLGFLWVAHYADQGGGAPITASGGTVFKYAEDGMGTGTQFVLIAGAASTEVFLDPPIPEIEKEASKSSSMLSLRQGVRTVILLEENRVYGPAHPANGYGLMPGPCIMFGTFRISSPEREFELGAWYLKDRLPFVEQTPGCIRARKLVGVAGWAKFGAFYEFDSLEARTRWKQVNSKRVLDPSHWSNRMVGSTRHVPGSPTIGLRTWPAP